MIHKKNIYELLNDKFPYLINRTREVIEHSEFEYSSRCNSDSFLWEHTVYVASMAMKISYDEFVDPLLPVITALFHDCGKFENGTYHNDDKPEEETSAEIAAVLLDEAGFDKADTDIVVESILALYNEEKIKPINTKIVHDADFIVKFGYMGFGNFFEKSVLRGMSIQNSILKSMSKELTYAACLEKNMFTDSGKKMAKAKSKITTLLFKHYLQELKEAKIAEYEMKEMEINCCKGADAIIPIVLVLPEFCNRCGSVLSIVFKQDKGIKCEKLTADIRCSECNEGDSYDFSFCLPEIAARKQMATNGSKR